MEGPNMLRTTSLDATSTTPAAPLDGQEICDFQRVDKIYNQETRDWMIHARDAKHQQKRQQGARYAFLILREFDRDGKLVATAMQLNSVYLQHALRSVLPGYAYIGLAQGNMQVDVHVLFHYRGSITTYLERTSKHNSPEEIQHYHLFLDYVKEDFGVFVDQLCITREAGLIRYDAIWALFKPDAIVYTATYENKNDPRCVRVKKVYEHQGSWVLHGSYLDFDGHRFSMEDYRITFEPFNGYRNLTELPAYPIDYHPESVAVEKRLIERGRRFVSLQGVHHCFFKGIAYMNHEDGVVRFHCNSRVMIDPTTCRRINPNYHHDFTHEKGAHGKLASPAVSVEQGEAWGDSASRNGLERKQRTSSAFREQDLLVASPVVLGFDLSEKCWLEFSLAGLQEIEWAEHPLQSVFLPAPTKSDLRFLESLVRSHVPRAHAQALQVKQKGLNIVLHGPPGFGKTMTANALVEHLKRPRYTLRASDLGHSAASIAQALDEAIETTRTWNAILQLDAADMYLEARQAYDTHHNSAVATFLQFMERHRSVLILTTDRLEHFDPSVLGYIHFALHFESPDRKTRRLIWKHHIAQSDRALQRDISEASDLSELDVDMLSKRVLNGRQIAGLVQVARGIADFEESALMPRHFEHVLRSAEHLERDVQGGDSYRDAMRQYF